MLVQAFQDRLLVQIREQRLRADWDETPAG
jgi:hypothetical protein